MKTLEQKIILALHPECKTWEECAKKEIISQEDDCGCGDTYLADYFELECQECGFRTKFNTFPISLPRVMQALKSVKKDGEIVDEFHKDKTIIWLATSWKLTDENAKDLNLEDQSEETKNKLNKLFNV